MHLPADWSTVLEDTPRHVRFSRRFHGPTGIGASDRIDLVVEGLPPSIAVRLNDELLTATVVEDGYACFEIAHVLQPRNDVAIELQLDPARRYDGQVRLEIRAERTPPSA